jgi:dTDP-4-dehydrorhamnose reductase
MIFFGRKDLDLTSGDQILDVLVTNSPDVIINCAAYTAVDRAEANSKDAFSINARAVELLAKGCADNDIVLIHLSTDYVFDGTGDTPFRESDQVAPMSVYGKTKLAGEIGVRSQLDRHIILRTSWVFGEFGNNFVKTMLRIAASKQELEIVSDQWGSPTSAKGIAECCLSICEKIRRDGHSIVWGTYHYSGFPYTNWYGFADTIFTQALDIGLINRKPKLRAIDSAAFLTTAKRPVNSRLDCTKLYTQFRVCPDDWIHQLSSVLTTLK